jgi:murein DD-endopeptidase MepM/ murein hydrolase activator NlpD
MRLPLNGNPVISTQFGVPDARAKFGRHAGIDYAVEIDTNVYAPVDGLVTSYTWGDYHGHVVQIFDGKYYHRLMHNSKLLVEPGQRIKEGQLVAKSGATGLGITGPHVHYDVSPSANPMSFDFIDPYKALTIIKKEEAPMAQYTPSQVKDWYDRLVRIKKLWEKMAPDMISKDPALRKRLKTLLAKYDKK